jgi:hypothetical protein
MNSAPSSMKGGPIRCHRQAAAGTSSGRPIRSAIFLAMFAQACSASLGDQDVIIHAGLTLALFAVDHRPTTCTAASMAGTSLMVPPFCRRGFVHINDNYLTMLYSSHLVW